MAIDYNDIKNASGIIDDLLDDITNNTIGSVNSTKRFINNKVKETWVSSPKETSYSYNKSVFSSIEQIEPDINSAKVNLFGPNPFSITNQTTLDLSPKVSSAYGIDAKAKAAKKTLNDLKPPEIELSPNASRYRYNTFDKVKDSIGDVSKVSALGTAVNALAFVSDYKDSRRKGRGVISSAVRAGAQFAAGEALGLWAIPVIAAKELPGAAIKGAEMIYKENRKMNSAANFQAFGNANFQDTQQLATMRQSGMEMAKMAQYNLQQTLMGAEATYLHR